MGCGQEKRARPQETRPEPTSNGNCSSWNFIVGKKGGAYSRAKGLGWSLQVNNIALINNLSTASVEQSLNNLWANCGPSVDGPQVSRIVKNPRRLMRRPRTAGSLFYRNPSLDPLQVSIHQPNERAHPSQKFFWPVRPWRDSVEKMAPNPTAGWGHLTPSA